MEFNPYKLPPFDPEKPKDETIPMEYAAGQLDMRKDLIGMAMFTVSLGQTNRLGQPIEHHHASLDQAVSIRANYGPLAGLEMRVTRAAKDEAKPEKRMWRFGQPEAGRADATLTEIQDATLTDGLPKPTETDITPDDAEPDPDAWRARLVFDREISEDSPVVKGTWVTVACVVSHVVDGMTWADILRAHPELTEEDIRVCLSYAVAEQDNRENRLAGWPK
jgi:uncharacterized protein (DUF433 family)